MKHLRTLAVRLATHLNPLVVPLAVMRPDLATALTVFCAVLGWWGAGGKPPRA